LANLADNRVSLRDGCMVEESREGHAVRQAGG
jgi:hypothetical protein